jgi:hypothetical protein
VTFGIFPAPGKAHFRNSIDRPAIEGGAETLMISPRFWSSLYLPIRSIRFIRG